MDSGRGAALGVDLLRPDSALDLVLPDLQLRDKNTSALAGLLASERYAMLTAIEESRFTINKGQRFANMELCNEYG